MIAPEMLPPFTIAVPAAGEFRSVGLDIARKYAELAGAPAADAGDFVGALTAAVEAVASGAPAGAQVELQFATEAHGLAVALVCNGRTATVRHALPAPQR
jgi:hypothetical protein